MVFRTLIYNWDLFHLRLVKVALAISIISLICGYFCFIGYQTSQNFPSWSNHGLASLWFCGRCIRPEYPLFTLYFRVYPLRVPSKWENSTYAKFKTSHIQFEWLLNTIIAMLSSNLIRGYSVLHQCTPCISILTFDAATFVWITKSILLFSDIFCK